MNILKYIPIAIILFFIIKILISFTDKKVQKLKDNIEVNKIEKGLLSVKDLGILHYDRFIKAINTYLSTHGFYNIVMLDDGNHTLTNFIGVLNNEKIYISAIQNDLPEDTINDENQWNTTTKEHVQRFISRMLNNNCKKGILLNNSRFSNDSIDFVDSFNKNNTKIEIKLIDGYTLTKSIRIHKNYSLEEGDNYELQ